MDSNPTTLYRLVTQPDGTMMVVDSVTGQPVYNDTGTAMGYTPETPAPAPSSAAPGYLGIPGYAAPTATGPSNIGPYGLPSDPLGNGPTVPGGAPQPAGATPAADTSYSGNGSDDGYSGGGYSRGGYSHNYGYGRSYGSGGYSSGYGGYTGQQYGGGGYDDQTVPRYGNNAVHPYFGGDPLVPGGQFAAADNGYDNRQQVRVPGGATAGPFEVSAAPMPQPHYNGGGGGGSGGGSGGGGKGITQDIYWHFANKIKDRMTGQSSGSYGDYQPTRYHPYRGPDDPRVQRRIEDMTPRLGGTYGRMWGDAGQAQGLYDNPLGMLREVAPNLSTDSILYNRLAGLPMQQIALLAGAGTRGWQGGLDNTGDIYESYYKKNNRKISHGRQGMDFLPYYRKQLRKDTSLTDYTNTLGGIYDRMVGGQGLDANALMQNLVNPAKKTYVAQQFKHQPGGTAGKAFMDAYGAVLDVGPYGDIQKQILAKRAQDAISGYQSQFSNSKVKKAPSLNSFVGAQLQPWM